MDQQQTIVRAAVEKSWPLTVGRGTLGCQSGAVVFRFNGVSYAVNDAARAQGFVSIDGIRGVRPSLPPAARQPQQVARRTGRAART